MEELLLALPVVISIAATVEGLVEPFFKKMTTVLIFCLLGNALVCINYFVPYLVGAKAELSGISGAITCGIAMLCLCINYAFTSRGKKIPKWVVAIHAVLFLVANLWTFANWYDIFALAAALMFVLSIAQDTTKHYRVLYTLNSLFWIVYDILAGAWENLATHAILFLALIVSILIRDVKKTKKEQAL